jgi:Copper amine oxidase, enzyme domain
VAYKLVPASNLTLLAAPSSMIAQRGGFAEKNLWVTPHSDAERFPSSAHLLMNHTRVEVLLMSKPLLQIRHRRCEHAWGLFFDQCLFQALYTCLQVITQ